MALFSSEVGSAIGATRRLTIMILPVINTLRLQAVEFSVTKVNRKEQSKRCYKKGIYEYYDTSDLKTSCKIKKKKKVEEC